MIWAVIDMLINQLINLLKVLKPSCKVCLPQQ